MFTGIVQATGGVREVHPRDCGVRVVIGAGGLDLSDVKLGDSVAVNGCCLTVVELLPDAFAVDVSRESLEHTTGFAAGAAVNLEKAMRSKTNRPSYDAIPYDELVPRLRTGDVVVFHGVSSASRVIEKCRCGPLACPVRPTWAMTWPFVTWSPVLSPLAYRERWQ